MLGENKVLTVVLDNSNEGDSNLGNGLTDFFTLRAVPVNTSWNLLDISKKNVIILDRRGFQFNVMLVLEEAMQGLLFSLIMNALL